MNGLVVRPDRDALPGHALLRVPGAGRALSDPRFQIMHGEGEKPNLGPRGWQVGTALLEPLGASAEGSDLILRLGPSVVDVVEAGSLLFALPTAGINPTPLTWPPDIPTSTDSQLPRDPDPPIVSQSLPDPTPQPISVPDPEPVLPERQGSRGALAWVLAGIVTLLLVVGAGLAARHYLFPAASGPRPSWAQSHAGRNEPPENAVGCEGTITQLLACAKTPKALYALGRARWASDPNTAFLILQSAIDRGSADAAYFLAQRYDPVGFEPGGPIPKAEPREAALDYRKAVEAGVVGAAERRTALKAWLEVQAKAGDPMAPLTLRDFWGKP